MSPRRRDRVEDPKEFLDWLATVEEILEFKGVPDAKQNLRQGSRSVDDYTNEFYQLVARNKLQKAEDQLVARYIGGLRVQLQDTVNLFDPVNVSSAHQRALIVERRQKRVGSGMFSGGVTVVGTCGVVRENLNPNPNPNLEQEESGEESEGEIYSVEYDSYSERDANIFIEEGPSDNAFFLAGGDGEPRYDEDDKEVDVVWEAIDKRMDSQRKDRREARLKQEIKKYCASNQQMRTRMSDISIEPITATEHFE
ncbi:hypothetical protein CRG98_039162 [Punica granatum]|uniref:PRP1 splicing factor N-terminal domain-containing protein n=1 Tax=Punica granatum TaxID=22663 RepID=A0A2I0I8W4_PUNGR|nr:hypothetical protein CRG98_039162 [Punica granatum]